MDLQFLVIFGVVLAVVLAVWINRVWTAALRTRQLGMEATDRARFAADLARGDARLGGEHLWKADLTALVTPIRDDDPTYASRFHAAFGKTETRK